MSRGDKNLDELFKDAFSAEEHEFVPGYWQEAQQMIQASKVAPVPFYARPLVLMGTIAVLGLSAILFLDSTPENEKMAIDPSILSMEQPTKLIAENSISTKIKKHKMAISLKESPTVTPTAKIEKQLVSSSTTQFTPKEKSSTAVNTTTSFFTASKNQVNPESFTISEPTNTPVNNSTLISKSIPGQKHIIPTINKTAIQKGLPFNKAEAQYTTWNSSLEITSLKYMHSFPLGILPLENREQTFAPKPEVKPKRIYTPLTLRLSGGFLWSQNKPTQNALISSNFTDRNIEFTAEYLFKKRWGIQSGISWSQTQVSQQHQYQGTIDNSYWTEEQDIQTVTNRVWWLGGWYYYPNTFDTILTDIYVREMDTVSQKEQISHKVQTIEVPILLTYNYGMNRFNLQVSSGISIGTVINSKGSYFSSLDPFAKEISSGKDFNSFQANFLVRTEISYGLNDHWWMSVRPQMKLNLNSVYPDNSTISPQVLYYGINAGIVYRF